MSWKKIYGVREFFIMKRLSRNIIEDREIQEDEELQFCFDVNGTIISHNISLKKLQELINLPLIKHPERRN